MVGQCAHTLARVWLQRSCQRVFSPVKVMMGDLWVFFAISANVAVA
jgi:hypothetical protein